MDQCDDPRLIYLPPWCDGGPEYGPRTSHEYERAWRDWTESIYGGGLWDAEQDGRKDEVLDVARERYDRAAMLAFMDRCRCRVPPREAEVFSWYWQDGLSESATARNMGTSRRQVRVLVNRLRTRMRHYAVRHAATGSAMPPTR